LIYIHVYIYRKFAEYRLKTGDGCTTVEIWHQLCEARLDHSWSNWPKD